MVREQQEGDTPHKNADEQLLPHLSKHMNHPSGVSKPRHERLILAQKSHELALSFLHRCFVPSSVLRWDHSCGIQASAVCLISSSRSHYILQWPGGAQETPHLPLLCILNPFYCQRQVGSCKAGGVSVED